MLPATLSAAKGLHHGGRNLSVAAAPGGERVYEKMVDRYAVPGDRAELPVHGMGRGNEELL